MSNPQYPSIMWAGPASSGRNRTGLGPYRYLVWHATSNPTSSAWDEAAFARNRSDGVGTHVVADANVCLQTQVTWMSVGHVGSGVGNRYGLAIEQCGIDSDPAEHWRPIIDRVVPWARLVMAEYGIDNRWLSIAEMRDGHSTGHVTHDMARQAWGGTDHTDPGPHFPKDHVVSAIAGPPPQTGDETMICLMLFNGDPTGAVFLTDGITAAWVQTEQDLLDHQTLHSDGSRKLGNSGQVRVVRNRHLIGTIVGDVPEWWQPAPTPTV